MTDDLARIIAELRAKAEAATPGPWRSTRQGNQYIDRVRIVGASTIEQLRRPYNEHYIRLATLFDELGIVRLTDDDADFIAAANPATILALLAVVEAAQARVEEGHGIDCAAIQTEEREPCDCGHDHLAAALSNLARNP